MNARTSRIFTPPSHATHWQLFTPTSSVATNINPSQTAQACHLPPLHPHFHHTPTHIMDSLMTHPSTAHQAKAFTAPTSLSYPGGSVDGNPPSAQQDVQQTNGQVNGSQQGSSAASQANGVNPATPAATPAAGQSVTSGIIPTLQ